jgi:hypothetical protein
MPARNKRSPDARKRFCFPKMLSTVRSYANARCLTRCMLPSKQKNVPERRLIHAQCPCHDLVRVVECCVCGSLVQLMRALLIGSLKRPSRMLCTVARGPRKEKKKSIASKRQALVPHVPAALGSEVEELRRTVQRMRVSKGFPSEKVRRHVSLQLGLDTNGFASGVKVGGSERGGGEVGVLAAHGVGGGYAGGDEASEEGCGAGDGRHFWEMWWMVDLVDW